MKQVGPGVADAAIELGKPEELIGRLGDGIEVHAPAEALLAAHEVLQQVLAQPQTWDLPRDLPIGGIAVGERLEREPLQRFENGTEACRSARAGKGPR